MRRSTRRAPAGSRPVLLASAEGYELGGQAVNGFADRPELPVAARTMIARYGRQYAPDAVSVEQRELLARFDSAPAPAGSELLRALTEDLDDEEAERAMALLPRKERAWVRDPSKKLKGASYPLTVGQLAGLSGVTEKQLRYWTTNALIPEHRIAGQRVFLRGAVIRALRLHEASPQEIGVLRTIAQGGVTAVRMIRLVGLIAGDRAHRVGSKDLLKAADTFADRAEDVDQHTHV